MSSRSYLAVWRPWIMFFTIGRPFAGIACLLLQLTVIGWPLAIIWAVDALDEYEAGGKTNKTSRKRFDESPQVRNAEETMKGDSKLENTKPSDLSLSSKIARGLLAAIIIFYLSAAIMTSLRGKDRDTESGGCPGMDATRSYWILASAIDFPYRDFCVDAGASYNPKTDEWIKTIKVKRKGVHIDIVEVKDEFLVPIPFKLIEDPSGMDAKLVLSRHHLGGYRYTPIYIEAGKKLPPRKLYDSYDPRYATKPRSAYTMSRIGVPGSEAGSGMSSWLPKFTWWQEIARMFYGRN